MRLVIIESPFAGDIEANLTYARRAMRDCILRGEAPIGSHLIYTQPGILRDEDPAERKLGIELGFAWGDKAELHCFYTDRGWSRGMKAAFARCLAMEYRYELRALDGPIQNPEE